MSKEIKCPNCNHSIDLSEAILADLQKELNHDVEAKALERTKALSAELNSLKDVLSSYVKAAADAKAKESLLTAQLATNEATTQAKIDEALARASISRNEEISRAKQAAYEQASLAVTEKEDTIRQLKEQLNIAQQKIEQGSTQAQGEAQELLIEEYLKESFPFDYVQEVKKGSLGADCVQVVNTRDAENCGKIYYESKRTKEFSRQWIFKLKEDMRTNGADIGVLVTSTMPKDMDRFGEINGVWVCTLSDFKALCFVLRETVISVYNATKSQENKGDKMSALYSYLTSTEFKMNLEAIVEGFIQMNDDLESEKRSMALIWKKREKQIQLVLNNTIALHGSIKGIAGSAVADIPCLQLPVE